MNIIDKFKNQRVAQDIHRSRRAADDKSSRLEYCSLHSRRSPYGISSPVVLKKKSGAKYAHYSGLHVCGSVWVCPVCSSIISQHRKKEMQDNIDSWRTISPDNVCLLITFTTPHKLSDSLFDVITLQDKAIRIMKQQPQKRVKYKVWRSIRNDIKSVGSFTSREVTDGRSGWHPHRHELYFNVRLSDDDLKQVIDDLVTAFEIAFLKAGGVIENIDAFRTHSVKVDQIIDDESFNRVSAYMSKFDNDNNWGVADEITKGVMKTAKNGNITPFGMLDAIRCGDERSDYYKRRFWEYSQTMKGKKQLFPSPGLKNILGVCHKEDSEIMEDLESIEDLLYADITKYWNDIKKCGLRGSVLELTKDTSKDEFMPLLIELIDKELEKSYALTG